MSIASDAAALQPDLVALRHALHRAPEIGLHLPRTQEKVLTALSDLPLEVQTGKGLSSVTAVLHGALPGPTVLLRGDMDALPVDERADVAFRSEIPGVMHACGHDLHTAMLVGAAHLLASRRAQLPGKVVFMFQPGEEGSDGAGHMLKEGILEASGERPIAAYALHVMSSTWANGAFATRTGPMMAACGTLSVSVHGAGGHGSAPHLAKDPVPAACEMVLALQVALTRSVDPFETAVITVGEFHAGTASNIIPETASFAATVRTFSSDVQALISERALRLCQGIAEAHGLSVDVEFGDLYPVTVNARDEAAFAEHVVSEVFGPERFSLMDRPITGAEDFSRIIAAVPGAMIFLGAAPAGMDYTLTPNNHSPFARFDDAVLADGAALYGELAMRRLTSPHVRG